MNGSNLTASGIISFAEDLEDRMVAFYQRMSDRWEEEETFQRFIKQGDKNKTLVRRTYQETITDMLEACFSFEGLDLAQYELDASLPEDMSYSEALEKATGLEEKAREFYLEVAERSESLLATIPMAFQRVAKTRAKHERELRSLREESGGQS